ncbi:hypothetical protein EXS73_01745 [Candidatus Pacearchaeota archaeon]|nr:hypothetical protein [Candidatus Pacearchaeota archaeon]
MLWYRLSRNMPADIFNDLTGYFFQHGLDLVPHEKHTSFVGKGANVRVFPQKIGFVFTGNACTSGLGSRLLREVYQKVPAFERLDEDQPGEIEELRRQFPFLYELR